MKAVKKENKKPFQIIIRPSIRAKANRMAGKKGQSFSQLVETLLFEYNEGNILFRSPEVIFPLDKLDKLVNGIK